MVATERIIHFGPGLEKSLPSDPEPILNISDTVQAVSMPVKRRAPAPHVVEAAKIANTGRKLTPEHTSAISEGRGGVATRIIPLALAGKNIQEIQTIHPDLTYTQITRVMRKAVGAGMLQSMPPDTLKRGYKSQEVKDRMSLRRGENRVRFATFLNWSMPISQIIYITGLQIYEVQRRVSKSSQGSEKGNVFYGKQKRMKWTEKNRVYTPEEKSSLRFAKALFNAGLIPQSSSNRNKLLNLFEKNGREMPPFPADRVVFDSWFLANLKKSQGDYSMLRKFIAIRSHCRRENLETRFFEEYMFISDAIELLGLKRKGVIFQRK